MAEPSGFPGVCWHKRRDKWIAFATVSGRQLHLGCFETPEEAHAAYLEAKARLNRCPRRRRQARATRLNPAP